MKKVIELKAPVETKNKPMRSDIAFDGFYRIYKNDTGSIEVEELFFRAVYTKTFYFDDGWISDCVDLAKAELNDPLEFIDLMLECDPSFKVRRHFDEEDEYIISIVGVFLEETNTEGSWEEGYYDVMEFVPKIAGYEIIKREHKKAVYNMGEDNYE